MEGSTGGGESVEAGHGRDLRRKDRDPDWKQRKWSDVTVEGNRVELSFLDEKGVPSRCGGGRGKRIGRMEGPVEELLVLIDSSIMEIFVNGGETVFTTRLYLEAEERVIDVSGCDGYVMEMI